MERIRLKAKKKFVYHARDPEVLLRRIGRLPKKSKPPTRKGKPFVYVSAEARALQREMRKRKKLGVKHDLLVPADRPFSLCIRGISRAVESRDTWRRNMSRYLSWVLAAQRDDPDEKGEKHVDKRIPRLA